MHSDTDLLKSFMPDRVFLFSGHRIDAPDRRTPRFPPASEPIAAAAIGAALDAWGASQGDLALAQGASGGDLLFLEACLARGLRLMMLLPFGESEFIETSILPSADGRHWRERYYALKSRLGIPPPIMPSDLQLPACLGVPDGAGRYERCNLWLLHTALTWGADKLHFLCLWNGGGADGAGGTAHLYSEARRRRARVTWLDTRSLW